MVLAKLLYETNPACLGFYVDVGAHHPTRYSNTQHFYQRGWRGINVEPAPGLIEEFYRLRPRDINLNLAIAAEEGEVDMVLFQEPALSTCDPAMAAARSESAPHAVIGRKRVPSMPLADVLAKYVPDGTKIDFLSVDVEGYDEVVLRSNNWSRWRPRLVVVEDVHVCTVNQIAESSVSLYLTSVGYECISKMGLSMIFADSILIKKTESGIRVA